DSPALHSFPTRRSSDLEEAAHAEVDEEFVIRRRLRPERPRDPEERNARHIRARDRRGVAGGETEPEGEVFPGQREFAPGHRAAQDRKSTRLNSSHVSIS